jgi:hypothetical protein
MLCLKGSKTIAALLVSGIALMAASVTAAHADDWHGKGNGWGDGPGHGHGPGWKKGHGGWNNGHGDWDDDRPRVIVRNGYYYAPPPPPRPRVYYVEPPRVYYAPPPPVYYAPAPVYVAPQPAISLQFRL